MNTYEAVRESVKIRLYCDTMLIDAVPIEEVEREISDLYARFGPCPLDNTVPEVDEVEDAVDIGVGVRVLDCVVDGHNSGFEGGAVLLLKGMVFAADRLNAELSWTRAGGAEVKLVALLARFAYRRKLDQTIPLTCKGSNQGKATGMENSPASGRDCAGRPRAGSPIEIGSSTGGTDPIAVPKYECEEVDVDVDVETDVEGPGAEEGDGWSNFLRFAGVTGADGVLVELQRLSMRGRDFRTGGWDVLHCGSLGVTTDSDIIHDTNRNNSRRMTIIEDSRASAHTTDTICYGSELIRQLVLQLHEFTQKVKASRVRELLAGGSAVGGIAVDWAVGEAVWCR
ncbi:hypothetical protein B0H14DRAFT_2592764 [Mycena olivaceomarginata]|nr:hypothetical protein B0H14DRAFT_2592764 [Mycena olivaceomarginata]